ncbi:MAG: YajQ family cyclic di-GMP-binding protein [Salinisphaera sp.]|nr:YajQ family cyclic di-GMP-binding protein [Salinisphaera sp.]MDN5938184.1 YajQ family cyclic di-GMP-binding protein [Salinisphaera sp.]
MPTFDIVSEIDRHELTNAVDQANRELGNRFDFKGVDAGFALEALVVEEHAPSEFQLEQMHELLRNRLPARGIDLRSMEPGDIDTNLAGVRRKLTFKQGIDQPTAKKIIADLKKSKLKVSAQVQGDNLRVSGKKRDDLQEAIALVKKSQGEAALQFKNFRD